MNHYLLIKILIIGTLSKFILTQQCNIIKTCLEKPGVSQLEILECAVQSNSDITEDCKNVIINLGRNYFQNESFLRKTINRACFEDLKSIKCESGQRLIFCILNQKDKAVDYYCQHVIQRLEFLTVTNLAFVSNINELCRNDIKRIFCNHNKFSQCTINSFDHNIILDSLQRNIDSINSTLCRQEVLQLSEVQGENLKTDNLLFSACAKDKFKFCSDLSFQADSSSVYKCLQEFINDPDLSIQCREQLFKREKLVIKDFKISKGLIRACRDAIRMYHCRRMTSEDKGVKLAQMLLCLETATHNGSQVSYECRSEMIRHRKLLMADYRFSPEVVSRCSNDINEFCSHVEPAGAKTIHCLLEYSRPLKSRKKVVSAPCQRTLENLIKITDPGTNWKVDPVLRHACESVVRNLCSDAIGEAKKMSCLMDYLNSTYMERDCEKALIQIQYFISRDFKLDPQLYSACREDAEHLCHSKSSWSDDPSNMDPERGPLVLPCLYRYVYTLSNRLKIKKKCEEEVKRVMRQRAVKVELLPEIEESCLDDLSLYCSEKTGPGEEILCLQDRYVSLKFKCKMAVGNFTEAESSDIYLNPVLKTYCKTVIDLYCKEELKKPMDGRSDIMECLIKHKNDPDMKLHYKCRAAVEHFQLISLNDYHFTLAFKEACRPYAIRYCPKAHTKSQVVECLSEVTWNDTLKDEKYKLSKECRYQLRSQLLQQREFVDLDPKLKSACEKDIKVYCRNKNSSQVLECLEDNLSKLNPLCHKTVFRIERHDLIDTSSDYTLLTVCKQMIKEYCKEVDSSGVLTCLKKFKNEPVFDNSCRSLVFKRMIEQYNDYRLNPELQHACSQDINKFCSNILKNHVPDVEFEGKVIHCLKVKFREQKLRKGCEKQLSVVLKETALNYKLNPLLRSLCSDEIRSLCKNEIKAEENSNTGSVDECLKVAFLNGYIRNRACRLEVAGSIEEAKADINVDPILHKACALDITKYCIDVPQGAGRILKCLQIILSSRKPTLEPDCENKLRQRMEMFQNADLLTEPKSANIEDFVSYVSRSSHLTRYLYLSVFSLVGVIFMLGIFCGRVSRRSIMLKKK